MDGFHRIALDEHVIGFPGFVDPEEDPAVVSPAVVDVLDAADVVHVVVEDLNAPHGAAARGIDADARAAAVVAGWVGHFEAVDGPVTLRGKRDHRPTAVAVDERLGALAVGPQRDPGRAGARALRTQRADPGAAAFEEDFVSRLEDGAVHLAEALPWRCGADARVGIVSGGIDVIDRLGGIALGDHKAAGADDER